MCNQCNNDFVSNTFLASKPRGSKRFILNLKPLTNLLRKSISKWRTSEQLLNSYPGTGFWQQLTSKRPIFWCKLPINKKYLRFEFNQTYEFNVLPYGLWDAPRVFTKLIKEVVDYLRHQGHKSIVYLDYGLCIGNTFEERFHNINENIEITRLSRIRCKLRKKLPGTVATPQVLRLRL